MSPTTITPPRRVAILVVVLAAAIAGRAQTPAPLDEPIFGFTVAGARAERELERRFLSLPSADRAREYHRYLTDEPHLAGSDRNRHLAEWMRDRWDAYGIDSVDIVEHEVLLPWPREVRAIMTAPYAWEARFTEDPVPGDPDSATPALHYHAYSKSGEVEAPVVYAASGNPENYDWLASQGIDVEGKIVLVRYSVPYSYRGFKALTAERRGAAGILIYSDPAEDGAAKGPVYPDGPWGNESHMQSGGIPYDFLVPGDPLTPGWASTPGARRIAPEEAVSLPGIISAPLSARDARVLLESLGGPEAPESWQGGLPLRYRVGPGATTIRLRVDLDDEIRRIQTVIGTIRGSERPDERVILGNHRDAWIYGGVDPSSGSASLMDLARSLGALARGGVRPKRSIVLASWDAEEFTLTSSTEWGEQHEAELREHAVAYLNVDSSTSGPVFTASAVPSLNRFIAEAAGTVIDPATGLTIAEAAQQQPGQQGSLPNAAGSELVNNRLGSGSDYTVFLNFLGIPVVDMAFDGPYGVYHSVYDNHQWVARIGDPGFRYHEAMTKLWGVMALRLANADVLPFDYRPYATRLREFAATVEEEWRSTPEGARGRARGSFRDLNEAIDRLARAADEAAEDQSRVLTTADTEAMAAVSGRLLRAERGFLDEAGIPGRRWYRHQIYAPKYTYAPEVLPAVAEAARAGTTNRVEAQIDRLVDAIERVTDTLDR